MQLPWDTERGSICDQQCILLQFSITEKYPILCDSVVKHSGKMVEAKFRELSVLRQPGWNSKLSPETNEENELPILDCYLKLK